MHFLKYVVFFLVAGTATLFMPHAKANCISVNMPIIINVASISVSSDLPVGATIPGTEQMVSTAGTCDSALDANQIIIACYIGSGMEVEGLPGVYATNVPGIGVAVRNQKGQRVTDARGAGCDSRKTPLSFVNGSNINLPFSFMVSLELVKTSDSVGSGSISQAQAQFGIGVYQHDAIGSPNTISYAGDVNVKIITCNVSPKSLTVTLGNIPVSAFTGVGSLSSPQDFNVEVNCDTTVQPELKISSANGYDISRPGVLRLTQESGVAGGVGVRMLADGQPATFDTYKDTASAQANQTLTLPFEVAYEQTGSQITPGTANSVATLTLGYK